MVDDTSENLSLALAPWTRKVRIFLDRCRCVRVCEPHIHDITLMLQVQRYSRRGYLLVLMFPCVPLCSPIC